MNAFTTGAMGLILGYAAFSRAGVEVEVWNVCLLLIGIVGAVHFLIRQRAAVPGLDRVVLSAACLVLALAALQLLPLPVAIVGLVSPMRLELAGGVSGIASGAPKFLLLTAAPFKTAEYVLTIAGYLIVFLTIRNVCLRCGERPWMVVWPLLIIAGLEAVLGVYQVNSGASEFAAGTYDNRDHLAGLLEMVLPFAAVYSAAILLRDRERFESPAAPALKASAVMAIGFLLLAAIVFTVSRMGYLASLSALLVAAACGLAAKDWNLEHHVVGSTLRKALPWAAVVAVIVVGGFLLPSDLLARRFADLAATDDISEDTRSQIWRDSSNLIKDYPLFGCGLGTYESCFLRYKSVAPMSTVDFAHNDYMQVLAEFGIFGTLAGLVFVGRLIYRAIRGSLHASSIDERYLAVACIASFVAILLHSLVDFNMYVPANGMTFAWIAGIAGTFANYRRGSLVLLA